MRRQVNAVLEEEEQERIRMRAAAAAATSASGSAAAAAPPTGAPRMEERKPSLFERASRVVELKRQPPKFSGKEEEWREWKFKFEGVVDLIGGGLPEAMKQAVRMEEEELELESMEGALREAGTLLNGLLQVCCEGKAATLVRLIEPSNGLLAWRQLLTEYEPKTSYRFVRWLSKLLNPTWKPGISFLDQLKAWENEIRDYERASGANLPSDVRCSVVSLHAPSSIRSFLKSSTEDYTENYEKLKTAIREHHARALVYGNDDQGKYSPMELDAIKGEGKEGKGKGKSGKGKGDGWLATVRINDDMATALEFRRELEKRRCKRKGRLADQQRRMARRKRRSTPAATIMVWADSTMEMEFRSSAVWIPKLE